MVMHALSSINFYLIFSCVVRLFYGSVSILIMVELIGSDLVLDCPKFILIIKRFISFYLFNIINNNSRVF
jgi:hypothetical protein